MNATQVIGDARRSLLDRRQVVLGGLMGLAGAGSLALGLRTGGSRALDAQQFSQVTPRRLGHFTYAGDDGLILPQNELSDQLYSNLRLGTYSRAGLPPVMMLVAYDDTEERNGLQLHRPEQCYEGSGFTIGRSRFVDLKGPRAINVRAVQWTAQRDDRQEHVLYWTRIGDRFARTPWEQNLAMMRSNLVAGQFDSVLVRLSTVSNDANAAFATLHQFMAELVGTLPPIGRRVLFGPGAA